MKQETKSSKSKNKAFKCLVAVVFAAIALTVFSSCAPIAGDTGGYGGGASPGGSVSPSGDSSSSGGKFFSIKILAENGRSAGSRATVMYEPVVTWKTEQGFRSAVKEFSVQVGNESPQTVRLGDSITSRGTYAVGSEVTVRYEAYGDVNFIASDGSTTTRTEVIASETKIVRVAAQGTTVNFKVSDGLQTPENFPGESTRPEAVPNHVTYDWGEASRHGNKNGLPSDPTTYNEGDLFTVEDGSNMTWDHAAQQSGFTGWSASPAIEPANGGQATNAPIPGDDYKMPAGGVVLTAQWNKKTYQITYYANEPEDAQGNKATVTGMPQQATSVTALDDATAATAPSITNPFDSKNWTFTGWNTQAGGGGTVYKSGQQITMMTEDITLYAQWTSANVYTVTYNIGSGPSSADSGWIDDDRYTVGTSPAITLPTLTATGYDFLGWRIDGESNNRGGGTSYTPTASVTATAQWSIKTYNITYSMNAPSGATGTSGTVSSTTREYMAEFTLATNSFVVPGYEFTGWYRNDGGSEEKVGDSGATVSSQSFIYVTENMSLYAKWNAVQYTINFAAGTGGSGTESTTIPNFTVESTSLNLPSTTTLTAPTAKLFDNGWSLTNGGTTKITSAQDVINAIKAGSGITISGNTITLYAVWKDAAASVEDDTTYISEEFFETFAQAWSAYQDVVQDGASTVTVKLYSNASNVAIEITEMGSITLDLNGRTLSGNGTAPVITIKNPDAGLTITGDGTITGGKIGIKKEDGTVTMVNGTISGNTADNGAGVYCAASGSPFTMQGGTITGNTATGNGGGVYCEDCQFQMNGGEITGNTASGNGGGVYAVGDGNLSIDGSVNITGNTKGSTTDNNVYLAIDNTTGAVSQIWLGSTLNAGSRIGVTLANGTGVFTGGWANCGLNDSDAPNVFTSDAGYTVAAITINFTEVGLQ